MGCFMFFFFFLPTGSTHSYSDGFDTLFLPDTTEQEVTTQLTLNSVEGIWHDGDRAYLAADNKLTTFDNGVSTGTPVPIDGCTPERFERPRSATGPWYLHCASDNDGTPQYVYLGQLRHLPTTGDYLPVRNNSILSRGIDSDGERTTAIVVIDRDARDLRVFTQGGLYSNFLHTVDLSQHCDSISGIHYQEPLNGRIRAIISCIQDEELKYYAIKLSDTFYLESANLLQAPGNVLSVITHGDHVCTVDTLSLTCYVTTLPTRAPDLLTFDDSIANAAFLETSAGVFLLVEINGAEQMVFVVSPDGIGERFPLTNSQAHCSDGCLPYLVIDDHLLLFKQNGVYYEASLYDLGAPSNGPTYRGRARFQPRFVAFQSQQAPPTPDPPPSPTSSTSSPSPSPHQSSSQATPLSSSATPTTSSPSVTPSPSPPTKNSTGLPPVAIAFIVVAVVAAVATFIILLTVFIVVIVCGHRRRSSKRKFLQPKSIHPPSTVTIQLEPLPLSPPPPPPLQEVDQNATSNMNPGETSGYNSSLSSNMSLQKTGIQSDIISHDSGTGSIIPLPFSVNEIPSRAVSTSNMPTTAAATSSSSSSSNPGLLLKSIQANEYSKSASELVPGQGGVNAQA